MKKLIKKGDVILDIGANVGFYSNFFSNQTGTSGKVHCFEPDKKNFHYLTKTTKGKNNVVLNQKAVSDQNGTIELYESDTLNIDHRTYKPELYKNSCKVDTITIDNYIGGNYLVNFIKLDIQGAEFNALKGMKNTLEKNKEIIIFTEFWPYGLKLSGNSKEELFNYFKQLNFFVYHIDDGLTAIDEKDLNKFREEEKDYYNVLLSKKPLSELEIH
jgi:FkbM family methyltransferase